jgi:protein-disulfide isomerase
VWRGEQNRFREYHDASFESGRRIDYTTGWRDIANTAGIPDLEEFESCVRSRRLVSKIEQDTTDAARLGVRVAPTLFINGERVIGTAPLEVLDSIVASNFADRRVSSRS